jgi:hypothetical protein
VGRLLFYKRDDSFDGKTNTFITINNIFRLYFLIKIPLSILVRALQFSQSPIFVLLVSMSGADFLVELCNSMRF